MPAVMIRTYRAEDHQQILTLVSALQDHERTIRPSRRAGEDVAKSMLKDMIPTGKPNGPEIFVAEVNGQVVGLVSCFQFSNDRERDPKEYVIGNLFIDAPWRGQGIGRALVSHARTKAKEQGCHRFVVGALAENESALASYRKMGFKPAFMYLEQEISE